MAELSVIELKAFLPAKDFALSKRFYQDLGFTLCWSNEGLAYLHYGPHGDHGKVGFLLQDVYRKEFAEQLQMHLLVADVDAWWRHVEDRRLRETYGAKAEPPEDRAWKMRDFVLIDPAGVCWRIAQQID